MTATDTARHSTDQRWIYDNDDTFVDVDLDDPVLYGYCETIWG